ncbi:MAG TPA: hypothetical protein VFX09_03815 [Burkholderiales bacterium]|nr:hypothetical protein [Burkholderiales bacterium]
MRASFAALLFAGLVAAQAEAAPPEPLRLEQAAPRAGATLPPSQPHALGPAIPGLAQGAIPQGLAYWPDRNWLLISYYFDDGRPSMLAALDKASGKLERSLTLLAADGSLHTGHVGGLAVSAKYLWIGSGSLYRVPLADIAAAAPVSPLHLPAPFRAESIASTVAYHDKRVWVGEFVLESKAKGGERHHLHDRSGADQYAWISGYDLDENENIAGLANNPAPPPAAILSVREKVQGLAFLDGHAILSISYGRKNKSTLAVYADPLKAKDPPHTTVTLAGQSVPVWFLDAKNLVRDITLPPMTEGITPLDHQLGMLFESGAAKYQNGGLGPLDTLVFIPSPSAR